jgi:hypothetical protein
MAMVEVRPDGSNEYVILKDHAVAGWVHLYKDKKYRALTSEGTISVHWTLTSAIAAIADDHEEIELHAAQ